MVKESKNRSREFKRSLGATMQPVNHNNNNSGAFDKALPYLAGGAVAAAGLYVFKENAGFFSTPSARSQPQGPQQQQQTIPMDVDQPAAGGGGGGGGFADPFSL